MRIPLALALAALCTSVARADTVVDNFTYTYVLKGLTYSTTFSLVDGQAPSLPGDSGTFTFQGVELDGNPNSSATVQFTPNFLPYFSTIYPTTGFRFDIFPDATPGVIDTGSSKDGLPIQSASDAGLTFSPGLYSFDVGNVQVPGAFFQLDSSSLEITQTITQDPIPTPPPARVAVTPEPNTLTLLSTGLLTFATAARRKLILRA